MVLHVLDALAELDLDRAVVVVGHGAERVTKTLHEQAPPGLLIEFVEQHVQRGTGDAVSVALTAFPDDDVDDGGDIVVLPGDTPLLRPPTLAALVRTHRQADAAATVLTARLDDPTGYGRVVRGQDDRVARIVEQADATDEERQIDEINTGDLLLPAQRAGPGPAPAAARTTPRASTTSPTSSRCSHDAGYPVTSLVVADPMEAAGVNDRAQLAVAEAELRRPHQRALDAPGRHHGRPRAHLRRRHASSWPPTSPSSPAPSCRAARSWRTGAEIGPDSHLVDCIGRRAGRRRPRRSAARPSIGADAVVGPWATLEPGCQGGGRRPSPGHAS